MSKLTSEEERGSTLTSSAFADSLEIDGESDTTDDSKESVDARIAKMKEESSEGYASKRRELGKAKDLYNNESGRATYYYKNISNMELSFSHPDYTIPSLPPGGIVDFAEYISKEEDLISYKAIRKYTDPMNIAPMLKRLTPVEFLREFEKKRGIAQAKHKESMSAKNKDVSTEDDKVSATVQAKVTEFADWNKKKDEEKIRSNYSKYDFITWIRDWTFTQEEFRWMSYNIKDAEILREIMERKQEQASLAIQK